MMFCEQHDHFTQLVRKAEDEKNQAVQQGLRAQQELAKASQELQRVCHDADVYDQHKDQLCELVRAEAEEWRRIAHTREGVAARCLPEDTKIRLG